MTGNQPYNDDDRETQSETGREREREGFVEGQEDEMMTERKADIRDRKKTNGKTVGEQR